MKYKRYHINWKVANNVLFISVNAKPFIFKGIDYREDTAGDLMLVQNNGDLTIYDTSSNEISNMVNNPSQQYTVVRTITFYNSLENKPATFIKTRLTANKQIQDSLMIQNSANVDYYPTNTKSLNNIPKVTWSEYGYDSENHTVVDNFIKDFKFDD